MKSKLVTAVLTAAILTFSAMNGFECVGIVDDANQMHDGTVIYDQPISK